MAGLFGPPRAARGRLGRFPARRFGYDDTGLADGGVAGRFSETVHQVENRLGVNAGVCGPGGLPSPCRYGVDPRSPSCV